jgi:deazaflavin-dependent oxidoreductase (nitroreductase family)
MTETKQNLNFTELTKMSDEVASPDGPGSGNWDGVGAHTKRVNDAVMEELRKNKGKLSGELDGLTVLVITAIGAKTGQPRTIPLVYRILDDRIFVVASMGGSVRNPPWFHNLVQNPEATVELNGETFQVRASIPKGQERDDLFRRLCETTAQWGVYQELTDRQIPVVELTRL